MDTSAPSLGKQNAADSNFAFTGGVSRADAGLLAEMEEAFTAILQSQKFSKAVVLRNLLRYLWEHRDVQVSEYAVGTDALRRNPDFDPKTDAAVRVNVARLRNKLREFYLTDGQSCPLWLTIPLNGHQLEYRFVRGMGTAAPPESRRRGTSVWTWAAVAALVVCCAAVALRIGMPGVAPPAGTPLLPAFWQQFLAGGKPVTIVVPTPLFQVWNDPRAVVHDPAITEFAAWRESPLFSRLSQIWGVPSGARGFASSEDLFATLELQRYLAQFGTPVTVVGTKELEADSLRSCNIILLGLPNSSFQLKNSLNARNFLIDSRQPHSVTNRHPRPGEPARFAEATQPDGTWRRSYGILAVFPGRTEQTQRLVLAGQDTRMLAIMVTSAPRLDELSRAIRQSGSPQFFESVLEMTCGSTKLMRIRPVAFRSARSTPY